jgi:hypothetical protein
MSDMNVKTQCFLDDIKDALLVSRYGHERKKERTPVAQVQMAT